LLEAPRRYLLRHRHSALLVALVTTFAIRPIVGESNLSHGLFSTAIVLLLLVALYTVQVDDLVGEREALLAQTRHRSIIGWILALVAVTGRLAIFSVPGPAVNLAGPLAYLVFFAYITGSQLRSLLRQREITGETISLSISVYLLLGFTWGILDVVLFQLNPQAFNLGAPTGSASGISSHEPDYAVLIYFSLTTLATVGYGDITPATLSARYASVAEGIAGQFYMAILVARLVAMHMNRSTGDSEGGSRQTPHS
jgi:voltage-gated potassium channel